MDHAEVSGLSWIHWHVNEGSSCKENHCPGDVVYSPVVIRSFMDLDNIPDALQWLRDTGARDVAISFTTGLTVTLGGCVLSRFSHGHSAEAALELVVVPSAIEMEPGRLIAPPEDAPSVLQMTFPPTHSLAATASAGGWMEHFYSGIPGQVGGFVERPMPLTLVALHDGPGTSGASEYESLEDWLRAFQTSPQGTERRNVALRGLDRDGEATEGATIYHDAFPSDVIYFNPLTETPNVDLTLLSESVEVQSP
jgi:hypothetical protein